MGTPPVLAWPVWLGRFGLGGLAWAVLAWPAAGQLGLQSFSCDLVEASPILFTCVGCGQRRCGRPKRVSGRAPQRSAPARRGARPLTRDDELVRRGAGALPAPRRCRALPCA